MGKFNVDRAVGALKIVKEAASKMNITSVFTNQPGSLGRNSYKIIFDAGKKIGTKGETLIQIVVDEFGNIWTILPRK